MSDAMKKRKTKGKQTKLPRFYNVTVCAPVATLIIEAKNRHEAVRKAKRNEADWMVYDQVDRVPPYKFGHVLEGRRMTRKQILDMGWEPPSGHRSEDK